MGSCLNRFPRVFWSLQDGDEIRVFENGQVSEGSGVLRDLVGVTRLANHDSGERHGLLSWAAAQWPVLLRLSLRTQERW